LARTARGTGGADTHEARGLGCKKERSAWALGSRCASGTGLLWASRPAAGRGGCRRGLSGVGLGLLLVGAVEVVVGAGVALVDVVGGGDWLGEVPGALVVVGESVKQAGAWGRERSRSR